MEPPPPRTLPFCVGCVTLLLYLCDPFFAVSPFVSDFDDVFFQPPLVPFVSVLFMSVVSSLTHQLDTGLLVFCLLLL